MKEAVVLLEPHMFTCIDDSPGEHVVNVASHDVARKDLTKTVANRNDQAVGGKQDTDQGLSQSFLGKCKLR